MAVNLQEAHFCSLNSQSNVYGLTKICMPCGSQKILVASIHGKVMFMEYLKTKPVSREVHFTYIPGDAEVVALDAFNKSHHGNGVVVGITFIKVTKDNENKTSQFLNIYSDTEPGNEFNLDKIALGSLSLKLDFIPFQLCHTEILRGSLKETVFLLSGNDHKIHMFCEDRCHQTYTEEAVEGIFPEFLDLQSNVLWIDILMLSDQTKRLTALGCQNGYIRLTCVDIKTAAILNSWDIVHDGPITSLKLFTLNTNLEPPSMLSSLESSEESWEGEAQEVHLVAANALEVTVVYRNVLEKGFSDPVILPDSDCYDTVLCATVMDIDFDGENEILLGTYGQELLVYKYGSRKASSPTDPSIGGSTSANSSSKPDEEFQLIWQRSFAEPLLAVDCVDVTGDGVLEIALASQKGLHILQHMLDEVADLCLKRIKMAAQMTSEDPFQQLQSENLT